jgi:hypothetical protein
MNKESSSFQFNETHRVDDKRANELNSTSDTDPTKSPWGFMKCGSTKEEALIVNKDRIIFIIRHMESIPTPERMANINLIIHAPELLDALKKMIVEYKPRVINSDAVGAEKTFVWKNAKSLVDRIESE